MALTEEHKKKIRKASKGHTVSQETRDKISKSNTGKKRTPEGIKNLSNAHKGIPSPIKNKKKPHKSGKNHWNWKGGISNENRRIRRSIEYRLWREAIFERDNYVCQKCSNQGVYLHPHHIRGYAEYPELRFAIDNGVTLCKDCHNDFHKRYGNKGIGMNQIIDFTT